MESSEKEKLRKHSRAYVNPVQFCLKLRARPNSRRSGPSLHFIPALRASEYEVLHNASYADLDAGTSPGVG